MVYAFKDREEAIIFIKKVHDRFNACGRVSISDVNQILGISSKKSDFSRGWNDGCTFKLETSYCGNGCLVVASEPVDFGKESEDKEDKEEPTSDNVNHPNHYKTKNGLETIQVIEAFTDGLEGIEATDTGNVIKYICRWKKKNGLEDLKKAQWYLNHLINHVEKEN